MKKPNQKRDLGAREAEFAEPSSRTLKHLKMCHIDATDSFLTAISESRSLALFDRLLVQWRSSIKPDIEADASQEMVFGGFFFFFLFCTQKSICVLSEPFKFHDFSIMK